jgi:hypothetical protein
MYSGARTDCDQCTANIDPLASGDACSDNIACKHAHATTNGDINT